MKKSYVMVALEVGVDGTLSHDGPNTDAVRAALGKVVYHPVFKNWKQDYSPDLFLIKDAYNQELEQAFWGVTKDSHFTSPAGFVSFDHIWCVGRDGLRVDLENGVAFVGNLVSWGIDYFRWWIENSDVGFDSWVDERTFIADFGDPEVFDDNVCFMKQPGYDIYGHWLLDFIPQLHLLDYKKEFQDYKIVFDNLNDWKLSLLEATSISQFDSYQCRLSEHRKLVAPASMKNGYALAQPINILAWNSLRAHFNSLNAAAPPSGSTRLFVSRAKFDGLRALQNRDAIEQAFAARGFDIVHPEQMGLKEQAHLLSEARIVVGEDGSALHSIMFARPGARLGVLMRPDRFNLWHAGICQSSGHSIGYFKLPAEDVNTTSSQALEQFIEALCR